MEDIPAEELDEEEQLLRRHRKEKKELQAKIQGMKNAVPKNDKKRRKQLTEDVAKLEKEMEQKHREELEHLKLTSKESKIDSVAVDISNLVLENQPPRISKAQKRREKKAALEKEREERIAEAEIENLSGARHIENEKLAQILAARELEIKHIPSDGHCMYRAIEDQLKEQDCALTVAALRNQTAEYMQSHVEDFLPFLTNPNTGDMYTPEEFGKYCDDIVNTAAWGGQLELRALSHILQTPIEIIQADSPPVVVGEEYPNKPLVLVYMRHAYGLGEHYNSVTRLIMAERLLIRALRGGKNTKIITLNGKKITKMPSAFEKLPGLKILDLQSNLISKVCPEIRTLTQLAVLNLGNNLLEEVPEEMKYLTSLKKLHLFGNRISRFSSGACDGLQNLIMLNLNNNRFTQLPQEVSKLKSLTCLNMNSNQLVSIPRELCFLMNLSELHLNFNQLICIPEEIKFLKKLQKLSLGRNNIEELPKEICDLKNLRVLDIAGNIVQIFPRGFQNLKLREFYCEGNPLFRKQPIPVALHEDACNLKEITIRFVMNQLAEKNSFLMQAIEEYPEIKNIISQGKICVICGKFFLNTWLECVQFVSPSKTWKISRNLQLVPLRVLLCSYKCFNKRDFNLFRISEE